MPKKSENSSPDSPQGYPSIRFPSFLALNTSKGYEAPQPPTFPKFFDLVQNETSAQDAPKKPRATGLFSALIGDVRILYQELLEDPGRFDERAAELLQNLSSGGQQLSTLTPEEMDVLDAATLDYARPRRSQPSSETKSKRLPEEPTAVKYLTRREALEDPSVPLVYNEGGGFTPLSEESSSLPIERPSTFWWKK